MSSATGKFSLVKIFVFVFVQLGTYNFIEGKKEGILKINQEKKNLIYKKKNPKLVQLKDWRKIINKNKIGKKSFDGYDDGDDDNNNKNKICNERKNNNK